MVDGLDDERAGDYTCADQALINLLHTRVAIATKAMANQKAEAITYPVDFSRGTAPRRKTNRSSSLRDVFSSMYGLIERG